MPSKAKTPKASPPKKPAPKANRTVKSASQPEPPKKVLVLRTCKADMTSYNNFPWPESGPVSAPDWNPAPHCGQGLHGFLRGEGKGDLADWSPDAKWLVVEVNAADIVDLEGKAKFPRGVVVFCGDQFGATSYIAENGCAGRAIVGGTATAGDSGTATAGYRGTATAGDRGILVLRWWDGPANRYRLVVGYGGEDGIEPGKAYRLDLQHKFVLVETPA